MFLFFLKNQRGKKRREKEVRRERTCRGRVREDGGECTLGGGSEGRRGCDREVERIQNDAFEGDQ